MTKREDVYKAIDSERDYQQQCWNAATTSTAGQHSVPEWLLYMRQYLDEAIAHVSHHAEPYASEDVLETVRKVTAMGVSCMEQHGAPLRAPSKP